MKLFLRRGWTTSPALVSLGMSFSLNSCERHQITDTEGMQLHGHPRSIFWSSVRLFCWLAKPTYASKTLRRNATTTDNSVKRNHYPIHTHIKYERLKFCAKIKFSPFMCCHFANSDDAHGRTATWKYATESTPQWTHFSASQSSITTLLELREASIFTDSGFIVIWAPAHATPALDRRGGVRAPATNLLKIDLVPRWQDSQ